MIRRYCGVLIVAGAVAIAALSSPVTAVARALPQGQDCGPYPAASANHVINASSMISCSQAVDVVTQLYNSPAIQQGGSGAKIGDWACSVYDSAKGENLGYVARCDNAAGSVLLAPLAS